MLELDSGDASFVRRHNGPSAADIAAMLAAVEAEGLEQLIAETVPQTIRMATELELYQPLGERELLGCLREVAAKTGSTKVVSAWDTQIALRPR